MTVDSLNIEAVSSRTKPKQALSLTETVLSCPKCHNAMEPMLLGMNGDGTQSVWWTCCEVKNKKCSFPLDMPQDIFWITRSAQDIERDEVPPPNLSRLPVRYQHLYPSLFQSSKKTTHNSRQGSRESTRSVSSALSDSASSSNGAWDIDETKTRAAVKLDNMRKPRVVLTQKKQFIPSLTGGSRLLAFAESFHKQEASTSILTRLRLGGIEKKSSIADRELAKKQVIRMLSTMNADKFKRLAPRQVQDMKKAVIEHVKKRRAEREQLAELHRITERRNEVVDVNDLIKAKLAKNKKEYQQRRIEQARAARMEAARKSSMTVVMQGGLPSMPGYEEDEEDRQPLHTEIAPYAVTPPYMAGSSSPGPSTSYYQEDGLFHQGYDYMSADYSGMHQMEMDHSGEVPPYGEDIGGSPFAELGPLTEDDLEGITNDPTFEDTFANAFGDDFEDLSSYN